MDSTESSCLIDEAVMELGNARQSMRNQILTISDILDKSNNVLLQIEDSRPVREVAECDDRNAYTYNKESLHLLTTIVDSFFAAKMAANNESAIESEFLTIGNDAYAMKNLRDFEDFLIKNEQKSQSLGGAVRKLLAISDTVAQMTNFVQSSRDYDENLTD